jgi:phosphatidylserine decarboxylase
MVRDGYYYTVVLILVAWLLFYVAHTHWIMLPPLMLALFFLWFFRDPKRDVPQGSGLFVSPADGKVTAADWISTANGDRLRLSIFLSVFDVHVNRAPDTGIVTNITYRKGAFLNAMDSTSSLANEQNVIEFDGEFGHTAVKQIAGMLARRIVCTLKEGVVVERGQRIGLIKFGSRVDVLLPSESELLVKVGDRVKGGSSVLATMAKLPQGAGGAPGI